MPINPTILTRTLSSPQGESGYKIVETLTDAGFDTWWVGGCVRDMLMDDIPDDVDIATDALPEDIVKLFKKTDETSARFGSILVSLKGCVFEVTTFREDDSASDGRHPESVKFGKREDDAQRRDFTVNAIYFNPISSEIYDPFNGQMDLNEKLIRFIGNPTERIEHDALRLLRAIRFRARINGQYHPDTFDALHKLSKKINILSGTRRLREIDKILLGPNPQRAFEDLWETDVIEHLLPELHACKGVAQPSELHEEGDVWEHTMCVIASFTSDHKVDVRLAALLHDIGKPVTFSIKEDRIHFNEHASKGGDVSKTVLDRLQCNSKRRDKIVWLIKHHMMMMTFDKVDDERKAHWYFHPWFIELLQLFWLDISGTTPGTYDLYELIIKDYNKFLDAHPRPASPLLSGEEVMDILGIEPGEKVGEYLKKLHEAQNKGEIKLKREAVDYLEGLM